MQRNADEAFGLYGLLADSADMDPERKSIEFHLDPNAKWSDGEPVTPEDVLFTYEVYTRQGTSALQRPHGPRRQAGKDRRAQRALYLQRQGRPRVSADHRADADHAEARLRHGDVRQDDAEAAGRQRSLYGWRRYRRASASYSSATPTTGARTFPSKRGFDNYDQITIEYFLNANAKFEAFKKGICAIHDESDPVQARARSSISRPSTRAT